MFSGWRRAGALGGEPGALTLWGTSGLALVAMAAFHGAFLVPALGWLAWVYLGCLFGLRRVGSARQAFYVGVVIGLGVFVPQMGFLWTIFQAAAIPLWLVLALFHGGFLWVVQRVQVRLGTGWAVVVAPVAWCGIEYFRSEVWWLRFSWFAVGSIVSPGPIGYYMAGLVTALASASAVAGMERRLGLPRVGLGLGLSAALLGWGWMKGRVERAPSRAGLERSIRVAGIQLEFPGAPEVLMGLNRLILEHPGAELLLLSEYTFAEGPPPPAVRAWCRRHGRWLVVGGKQPMEDGGAGVPGERPAAAGGKPPAGWGVWRSSAEGGGGRFYNTAFVIDPRGEVVFTQAKSRPIPFFRDGEPALERRVWESPWGKLGIAICYDASYRRVMDDLIRQGATGLLVPTMDLEEWGPHEHRLNARMARIRAAEYGVPMFRVASSGISQIVDREGRELAMAPCPGNGAMIAGELRVSSRGGSVPADAWVAPACAWATGGLLAGLGAVGWHERRRSEPRRATLG